MGLSVAISGGIILTVFVLILLSLPGLAGKMFSIGDVTTQVTQHEQKISNTEISMNYLSQSIGSPRVNFTLGNDGSEKLWNFEDYDLFVEYDGAISGQTTQQQSYNGECLGVVPPAGNWCIQSISNDVADPKILNSGEQASIWTNLSENLASKTAIITLVTDNGVTFTTSSSFNTLESLTNVTDTGCALNQIIQVNSTGFWECATGMKTLKKTADQTINAGAGVFTDITDLTFPVENGKDYAFKFYVIFRSAAVGTGFNCAVNGPAGTVDYFTTYQTVVNNPTGLATWLQHHQVAFDASTLKTSTITAGVDLVGCSIEGRFLAAADGTFAARFANELANNNIVVQKGSWGYWF